MVRLDIAQNLMAWQDTALSIKSATREISSSYNDSSKFECMQLKQKLGHRHSLFRRSLKLVVWERYTRPSGV